MKLRVAALSLTALAGHAHAGGLFLPGSGAISTSRAGAAVASVDDGEALSINPAGLAKTKGWTLTISAAITRYYMKFNRSGAWDDPNFDIDRQGYEGDAFAPVENDPKPPLCIGSFQPIPVIAIVSDLGGRIKGLRVAAGLYAPNSYPFRDMSQGYTKNAQTFVNNTMCQTAGCITPPATRYDTLTSESTALFPSIAAAYRILPMLDVGARFSAGNAKAKTQVMVWGTTNNVEESVRNDTLADLDVKDSFIPTFGLGFTLRPTPWLEVAAVYNSGASFRLKGKSLSTKGVSVDQQKVVGPIGDNDVQDRLRCEVDGNFEIGGEVPACITLALPQNATAGIRYKALDSYGRLRGDIELNVGWENWGKRCDYDTAEGILKDKDCTSPGQFLVNLDAGLYVNDVFTGPLEVNSVNLGLQDVFTYRLGGSFVIPLNDGSADPAGWPSSIILRAGLGYDTQAAKPGFLRASFDGAARTTATVGAAYRTPKWELNLGGGVVFEGTNRNDNTGVDADGNPTGAPCNPTPSDPMGCGDGITRPVPDRTGPDPTNPLIGPEFQSESPFNQGTITSHYVMFMLGYNRWW